MSVRGVEVAAYHYRDPPGQPGRLVHEGLDALLVVE